MLSILLAGAPRAGAQVCSTPPSEAQGLTISGHDPAHLSWLPPDDSGGSTSILYDVLRSSTPGDFSGAQCLATGISATSYDDGGSPSTAYYLVRSRNGCGGSLGAASNGGPRTGPNCLQSDGGECFGDLDCVTTACCGGFCRDLATNVDNCGSCGNMCVVANGVPACVNDQCEVASCNAGYADCNVDASDGCEASLDSVATCGGCNNVCPGQDQSTGTATCDGSSCGYTCVGENYDINNNSSDGCEWLDSPTNNHTTQTALSLGTRDCNDGSTVAWSGGIPSDWRTHVPAVSGFNSATGAAPDYAVIFASGGLFCTNDFSFTLTTSGGSATCSYGLTVTTNLTTRSCTTSGSGTCTVTASSGSYSDNTNVYLQVQKNCFLPPQEQVAYSVQGHL